MDVKVTRRLLRGLGANVYGQIVTVIVQLLGVPILLHAWGAQLYGEWLIMFAIPAYLSMMDLGFSQSAGNDMTARFARGDCAGALAVFQSLSVLIYGIAAVGSVLIAVLLWCLPLGSWLQFQALDLNAARWVLWLLAAQVFATLPDGVTHAGFRASGEYAFHRGLHATARLLQFFGIWIAALTGGGPVVAALVFFSVRIIATIVFSVLLVRRHRWLQFGVTHARRAELRRLGQPALANMAIPIAQALNIQGMVLAVGATLGALAVVAFSTLRTLTRLAMQLSLAVANATEPELAAAHGEGNLVLMQALFAHALRGGLWAALAAATGLAFFGNAILAAWTQGAVLMDSALFTWLLGSAVASVFWYGALIVLKAANCHMRAASIYMFASAAAVGFAVLLLHWTGVLAYAGIVLLAMDVVMALYTVSTVAPLLGVKASSSLRFAVNPLPLIASLVSKNGMLLQLTSKYLKQ